jgi:hypothetical protein
MATVAPWLSVPALYRARGACAGPGYMRWWVWTAVVLLLALLMLLGRGTQHENREEDGILYRVFQRAGGGRAPKPQ